MEGLGNKSLKWKGHIVIKGLKINQGDCQKRYYKDGMSERKVDPCAVCSLRVQANSVMCGKWIHG